MARILVVDDEPAVLKFTATVLRNAGWQVYQACDADGALQLANELNCALNVLVTDMEMPGMRGDELIRQIRTKCPLVDALVISGTPPPMNFSAANVPLLKKPYKIMELVEAVKHILSCQI